MVAEEEDLALIARSEVGREVNRSLGYPIVVGAGLTGELRRWFADNGGCAAVLADAHPPVAARAAELARALGAPLVTFHLGEARKRLTTLEVVLERLHALGLDRRATVVGVGGGVASDLFGLAAALYMRGIGYVHVATSLVAMVDAAIGGKTGVNLSVGKNLAGGFRDPRAVFCDLDALWTLPRRALREGLAEVVKAGVIEGGAYFEMLETLAPHRFSRWPWFEVVTGAIGIKAAIVADDRDEAGVRELLNLGHTFAHGIEAASGWRVSHGAAVALGLRAAGLLALRTHRWTARDHVRLLGLLALLGMPLRTHQQPRAVYAAMRGDKKRRDGKLRFVLPRAIGDVEAGFAASPAMVLEVLERLRRPPEAIERP